MKEKLLISACLLGRSCKYNGGHNLHPLAGALADRYALVPVCPECLGGLPIPHQPSELRGDRVFSRTGEDVTAAFRRGAEETAAIARREGVRAAVLKERSPSCGCRGIYDGTFTGAVVPGMGLAARALADLGLTLYGESDIGKLLK